MENPCQLTGDTKRFGGGPTISPSLLLCSDEVLETHRAMLTRLCPVETTLDSGELVLDDESGTIPAGFRDITVRLAAGGPVAVNGNYDMTVVGETFRFTAAPGSVLPAIDVEGTGTIQYIGLV